MNKVYKVVWSSSINSFVVCSEFGKKTKSANKISTLLGAGVLTVLFSPSVLSAECSVNAGGFWNIGGSTCDISEQTKKINVGWQSVLGLGSRANEHVTVKNNNGELGDLNIDATIISPRYTRYDSSGISLSNESSLNANNITVNIKPGETGKTISAFGLTAWGAAVVNANSINVNAQYENESQAIGDRGSDEAYGIQVGTAIIGEDNKTGKTSKIEVKDANISLTNTVNSQSGFFGLAPYQMSAIRVIRNENGSGSNAIFESTGLVTINVSDSSSAKSGNYITGIYVSGDDNKVILNDSNITLGKSGQYSSALKIGKGRDTGTGGGVIESHGHMLIDTTLEESAPAVRLIGTGSKLISDYTNSSNTIKTANTAILFGNKDYLSSYKSADQEVKLKDAIISTTSNDASLVLVNSGVTGAKLHITGQESLLKAAENGWLVEVEDPSKWNNNNAELTFTLDNNAKIQGLMHVSGNSRLDVNIKDNAIWQLQSKSDLVDQVNTLTSLNLSNGAIIDAATQLTSSDSAIYTITVPLLSNDSGIISLDNGKYKDSLTINGSYVGSGNAIIKMNTLWNAPGDSLGTNSLSDILVITNSASGNTNVIPIGVNGQTNVIDGNVKQVSNMVINTVPVIRVNQSGQTAFTGNAKTTGISEVQLAKRTVLNDKDPDQHLSDEYYWTASASVPSDPSRPKTIYDPSVSAYVGMPRVNMEQGYTSLSTLHERRGENQTLAWDECGSCGNNAEGQSWGRIIGKHLEQDGKKRLNLDSNIYGLQLGHDFDIAYNEDGSHNFFGGYISYTQGTTNFSDKYRATNGVISSNKHTGKGISDAVSIGLTNTFYAANGTYLDLIGQTTFFHNKYKPRDTNITTTQNGYGAALSVEAGRPFALGNYGPNESGWLIEPQSQLIYQHIKLDAFNDDYRHIDQNTQQGLRGRLGGRLAYNEQAGKNNYQTRTIYALANIWHDFLNPSNVDIGSDSLREKYESTWGEIGLGVQLPVVKHGYLYTEARYEHSFGSTIREGYRGTIGFKLTWK